MTDQETARAILSGDHGTETRHALPRLEQRIAHALAAERAHLTAELATVTAEVKRFKELRGAIVTALTGEQGCVDELIAGRVKYQREMYNQAVEELGDVKQRNARLRAVLAKIEYESMEPHVEALAHDALTAPHV